MTELNKDVERLRELLARAGADKWVLQDGCSWRRIGTDRGHDGNILCPYNSRHDNHPDLSAPDGVLELIVETHNALPALLDERDSLLSKVSVMREAMPWGHVDLADWAIVGMNHYYVDGQRHLFVSMSHNGRCIRAEGVNQGAVFADLREQARALLSDSKEGEQ